MATTNMRNEKTGMRKILAEMREAIIVFLSDPVRLVYIVGLLSTVWALAWRYFIKGH